MGLFKGLFTQLYAKILFDKESGKSITVQTVIETTQEVEEVKKRIERLEALLDIKPERTLEQGALVQGEVAV